MGGGEYPEDFGLPAEPLTLRKATKADLDAITRIVEAGFPDDPGCDYKYPYRHDYPEDFLAWTRKEYEEYLDQPDKFVVLVATIPGAGDNGHTRVDEPVAYAVWDVKIGTQATGGDRGIDERHDANPMHMRAYANTMSCAFAKHFARYGNGQLHLAWLITHPDYRRRGAGTMLCKWGEEEALLKCRVLTVMASPLGRLLYTHLGYELVGSETAQLDGEDDKVDIDVMMKTFPHRWVHSRQESKTE